MRLYHLIKLTLLNLAFAAVYYALARAGLSFATINHSASPIWPASGFAISTLILGGPSLLPGIFLAAFFANLPTGSGLSAALLIAFGNSAEALCARWMFYRVTRMRRLLQNYTGAAAFIVSSAFATMVSASVGALALWLFAGLAGQQADDVWLTWWAGDALGSLLIAPVILGLTARIRAHALTIRQLAGAAVAGLPALAVAGVVFSSDAGSPWLFAIFPFVLLAATLVREAELRMITLAVATCAIAFVINKQGPFNDGDVNLNLIHLQFFLASLALTSLVIEAFKKIGSLLPPALALCAGWILSGVLFFSLHRYEHADEGRRFVNTVELAEERIRAHLRAHEDILLSGVGLFAASRAVEGYEWDVFVRSQALDNRFPDLESLSALLADGTEMSIPIKNAQATPIFRDSLAESISKVNRRPALALRGTRASLYYPFYSGHAFRGWVVSSFDLNRAISVALEEYPGQLNFHLLPKEPNPGEIVRSIQLSQSELQIGWSRGPNFPPGLDGNLAWPPARPR